MRISILFSVVVLVPFAAFAEGLIRECTGDCPPDPAHQARAEACAAQCAPKTDFFENMGCVAACLDTSTGVVLSEPDNRRDETETEQVTTDETKCHPRNTAGLSHAARILFDFACDNNFVYEVGFFYPAWDLAKYLKDEDGTNPLLRTGYEVALYRRLKHRLIHPESYPGPLPIEDLFAETIEVMIEEKRGGRTGQAVSINVVDVMLTAENVTRLLARPEQWWDGFPVTPYGQNRMQDDKAFPVFMDLTGQASVDGGPTLFEHLDWSNFQHNRLPEVAFGPGGPFQFFPEARRADDGSSPAHWNGGIHYYYWLGALGRWSADAHTLGWGGYFAAEFGAIYEYLQKGLTGQYTRAQVQIELGFDEGALTARDLVNALGEIPQVTADIAY